MLLFVYGEHVDGVIGRKQELIKHFQSKHDPSSMNVTQIVLQAKTDSLDGALEAMTSPPFLAEKKLVVIEGLLTHFTKAESKHILKTIGTLQDDVIVLFVDTVKTSKAIKHAVAKYAEETEGLISHHYAYPKLEGASVTTWAATRAAELSLAISTQALQLLVRLCLEDLGRIEIELKRLKAYYLNDEVDGSQLEMLIPQDFEQDIFAFTDLLGSRNLRQIFEFLNAQRAAGLADGHLFAMSARQIRLFIQILANERANPSEAPKTLGIHPYVYRKTLSSASGFSASELVALHAKLYELERGFKTGVISETEALNDLLFTACKH